MQRKRLSEAALLELESARAKAAIAETLEDLKSSLATAVDPRIWTQQHPWVAMSMAAATGFAAAVVVIPAKGETLADKWTQLAESVKSRGEELEEEAEEEAPPRERKKRRARSADTPMGSLVGYLFELLKTVLPTFIAAAVQRPPAAESTNGRADSQFVGAPPADPGAD